MRVATKLEKEGRGLNLCWEVLNGVVCHTKGAWPKTPEGCVVRYADRIAYMNHDIEDAVTAGVLRPDAVPADVRAALGRQSRSAITTLVTDLIANSRDGVIAMSQPVAEAYEALHAFMYGTVYVDPTAKREEKKVDKVVSDLYAYFCENPMQMPQNYLYIVYGEGVERAVTDFISRHERRVRHQSVRKTVRAPEVGGAVRRGANAWRRRIVLRSSTRRTWALWAQCAFCAIRRRASSICSPWYGNAGGLTPLLEADGTPVVRHD